MSSWLEHLRRKILLTVLIPTEMQYLVDRSLMLSPLLLWGHGLADAQAHQCVSGACLMCSVVVDVQFLGPCFGGWYGFSCCHTSFVPVEWIGRIPFMGLKPCQNYKMFCKWQTEKPVLLCLFRRKH